MDIFISLILIETVEGVRKFKQRRFTALIVKLGRNKRGKQSMIKKEFGQNKMNIRQDPRVVKNLIELNMHERINYQ